MLISCALSAQTAATQAMKEAQVPAAAVATFRQAHPAAKAVKWEPEDGSYEASFRQGAGQMSVVLAAAGTLLETETAMPVAQLPAPVRAQLSSQYAGYRVTEASKIVGATGVITYEAEVSKGGQKMDVLFSADGVALKQESGGKDDDDE